MKQKFLTFGPSFILMAAVLWGLDGIARRSLFVLPPITIVFFEHLIGSILILPFAFKELLKIKFTKDILFLGTVISLFSGVLGTLWFTTALSKVNFISFSVVFLLQQLEPLFAITFAMVMLKEKITKEFMKWAALAMVATFFVIFKNGYVNFQTGSGTMIAALYAIGAAAAWGTGTVISKMLLQRIDNTSATAIRFAISTLFAGLGVVLLGQSAAFSQVQASHLATLIFIALSTGMMAMWLYYKGLQKTEAKIATLLEQAFPLVAVIIDAALYKTFLAPSQYLAALVLIFAISRIARLAKE